nr:putative ribonuclease H-like domain-containing protein [Tanacetum cinerariifolium]
YKGSYRSRCEERCVFFKIHCSSNWFHKAHLESTTSNAQDACNADAPESSGNSNPTAISINPLTDHMETLAVETPIPTISSLVPTACLDDSPQLSSDSRLISKKVTSQDDTPSLDNILTLTNKFEDILGVTTNTDDSKRVEADLGNMEYNISASLTPTLRIHKDHPKSQIIGPVDTPVQTRTKSKEMEEQSFIATIHQKKNPALLQFCLFSCFLSKKNLRRFMILFKTQARHQVTPKECHLHAVKRILRYLKGHPKVGLWYPKESPFDLVAYSDSDYYGATQDCKSTTRGCHFLGRRLISWQCKKQTIVATSTTEAEYVAAASGCGQVLDYFEKMLISVDHIHTDDNVVDLLTKSFDAGRFQLSMPCEALSKEISSSILLSQYTKRARIAQSSALLTAADEPASPIGDDKDRDRGGIAQSGEDAPIKGRSLDEGEEATIERSTERGSDDTEEMVTDIC